MGRPPRQDVAGRVYHVIARGVGRRTLCDDPEEFRYLLSRILYAVRRGEIILHAYVIMRNHVHLVVRSNGKLADAMRRILGEHALRFNRRRDRSGPLHERRYIAIPVRGSRYGCILILYIHENPCEAGIVQRPEDYLWSSARHLASRERPVWLDGTFHDALGLHRRRTELRDSAEARAARARLVELRMKQGCGDDDPLDDLAAANAGELAAWMIDRAREADGAVMRPPVTTPSEIRAAVGQVLKTAPVCTVRPPGGRQHELGPHLAVGLERELVRAPFRAIGLRGKRSEAWARRAYERHQLLMRADAAYAGLAGEAARRAIRMVVP